MSTKKKKTEVVNHEGTTSNEVKPVGSQSSGLGDFMSSILDSFKSLELGLLNLEKLPDIDMKTPKVMPLSSFNNGRISFGRDGRTLVLSAENVRDFNISTRGYIALIEKMFERRNKGHVIELQPCHPGDFRTPGRPQIIGQINTEYSMIMIHRGVPNGVIRSPEDIGHNYYYYMSKQQMAVFYCAAKMHLINASSNDLLTGANSGIVEYDIPSNPLQQERGVKYYGGY